MNGAPLAEALRALGFLRARLRQLRRRAPPDVVNFEPGNSGQVGRTQQMQASEGPRVLLRGRDKLVVIQEGQGYRENFQIAGAPHLKFR